MIQLPAFIRNLFAPAPGMRVGARMTADGTLLKGAGSGASDCTPVLLRFTGWRRDGQGRPCLEGTIIAENKPIKTFACLVEQRHIGDPESFMRDVGEQTARRYLRAPTNYVFHPYTLRPDSPLPNGWSFS